VKKAAIASARRVIIAADGSKFGHTTYAYVGPCTLAHTLVTDTTAPAAEFTALESLGTVVQSV
jgi:DeoR/GlpR family transcriptional regulator of sugar metabolism